MKKKLFKLCAKCSGACCTYCHLKEKKRNERLAAKFRKSTSEWMRWS